MTRPKQTSISPRVTKSTARKLAYVNFIKKYPLYSILLVLDEYEKMELYEECTIIKSALDEYNISTVKKNEHIIGKILFPTSLADYTSTKFQKSLDKHNIVVTKEAAKEKATLIKLKLPIRDGMFNHKE